MWKNHKLVETESTVYFIVHTETTQGTIELLLWQTPVWNRENGFTASPPTMYTASVVALLQLVNASISLRCESRRLQ